MRRCIRCGNEINDEKQKFCGVCGAEVPVVTEGFNNGPATYTPTYPMKWFNFLIYFALFLGSFVNFVYGCNYIMGTIYTVTSGATPEQVYGLFGDGLKVIDVIYGILLLVMAVWGIVTRFRLAKYKADGPVCLYVLYIAAIVLGLLYNFIVYVFTGINAFSSLIVQIIVQVVIIIANYSYFTKRAMLFVNK